MDNTGTAPRADFTDRTPSLHLARPAPAGLPEKSLIAPRCRIRR